MGNQIGIDLIESPTAMFSAEVKQPSCCAAESVLVFLQSGRPAF